jgi:cleavage and polyadenylation specificity factor subunit 1
MTRLPSTLSPASVISESNDLNNGDANAMDIDNPSSNSQPLQHILTTTQTGTFGLITPVSEPTYRRLIAIQTYLVNQLDHACSLNPKAYRNVEHERFGSRGMLDGTVLGRWCELSSQRKAEACAKVGFEEWVIRGDLEIVGGGGLGYL